MRRNLSFEASAERRQEPTEELTDEQLWRRRSAAVHVPERPPVRTEFVDDTRYVVREDYNHDRSWRKAVDLACAAPQFSEFGLREQIHRLKKIIHSGDPEGKRSQI